MTALSRVRAVAPGEGREYRLGADRFRLKSPAVNRSSPYSLIVYEGAPGIPGPPPHRHRTFEEAWFILQGRVEFVADGRKLLGTPGTYLHVPRGVAHTFRVVGRSPARWIGLFSPGRYVRLLEELGPLLPERGPPDARRLARLFRRYRTELA